MSHVRTRQFKEDMEKLPESIRELLKEKFELFKKDPNHSSFKIKKMKGKDNIWEGHISEGYVFTFTRAHDPETNEEKFIFRRIGKHSVYKRA